MKAFPLPENLKHMAAGLARPQALFTRPLPTRYDNVHCGLKTELLFKWR